MYRSVWRKTDVERYTGTPSLLEIRGVPQVEFESPKWLWYYPEQTKIISRNIALLEKLVRHAAARARLGTPARPGEHQSQDN